MLQIKSLVSGSLSVLSYECSADPSSAPYPEMHRAYSVSFVHAGSFGYRTRGRHYELVPGCVLVGRPGDEFVCTHDHHLGGDRCLSVQVSAEWVMANAPPLASVASRAFPPVPALMPAAELARACAEERCALGLEVAALSFVERFLRAMGTEPSHCGELRARDRRRITELALWIEERCADPLDLDCLAGQAGLSCFHLLRLFARVTGTTPHQYLIRSRLRRAARLLCRQDHSVTEIALEVGFNDLSNFSRTFRRAAGVSPARFRLLAGRNRKFHQVASSGIRLA